MRNVLSGISFTEEGALKASSPLPTVFSLGIWPETEKKKKCENSENKIYTFLAKIQSN